MLYKSGKCYVCGGNDIVITYQSDNMEQIFIEPDGSIIFSCPPYEDNDLTIEDIKKDSERSDHDFFFSCYDCEDECNNGYILVNGIKYSNAENAFNEINRKYSEFDPYGEEMW